MGLCPLRGTTCPSAPKAAAHWPLLLSPVGMYLLQKHQPPIPCQPSTRASSLTWWSGHRPQALAPCSYLSRVSRAPRALLECLSPPAAEYPHEAPRIPEAVLAPLGDQMLILQWPRWPLVLQGYYPLNVTPAAWGFLPSQGLLPLWGLLRWGFLCQGQWAKKN